ncbi:hypothetical protein VOLCADRAFT_88411 [Volvox carteri f. nagariensis]|uniref:Uncharacterized protein n=1 Tax=Volvox carteri f. nagariensis TaxID=3068 RepID=D8TNA0_VOLCA|nr:uncharacterized protein VOLCADRAFT_88411 [Volvox carteri f. nagariensis]EFJ50953.1 hypothetical protein VOLCADRAFT_88411 [Volvox carteri f. nagariensis]|eukprot:XP_002947965.1 hypothetical protein VOLCADRAFT_88411 [Volvox carteri f. nagariensis]
MAAMLGHVLSTANTVRRMATGEATAAAEEQHKLTDFLTTLVTYPALYIFATASASEPLGGEVAPEAVHAVGKGRRAGATAAAAAAIKSIAPPILLGGSGGGAAIEDVAGPVMALAPEPRYRLSDFPEGRALVALERWCREPVFLSLGVELWAHSREYARGFIAAGVAPPWLAGSLGPWLESFPDAAPPLGLEGVVEAAVREAREGARAEEESMAAGAGPTVAGGPAAVGWEGGLPLRRLAAAASPNLAHISRQLQQRYRLTRGRTWLEFAQIFLGIFRSWLRLVAGCFSLAAMMLRLLGTGATVLSGAVAFTVIFSIALSVLSALLTVAATAADAIGSLLRTLEVGQPGRRSAPLPPPPVHVLDHTSHHITCAVFIVLFS